MSWTNPATCTRATCQMQNDRTIIEPQSMPSLLSANTECSCLAKRSIYHHNSLAGDKGVFLSLHFANSIWHGFFGKWPYALLIYIETNYFWWWIHLCTNANKKFQISGTLKWCAICEVAFKRLHIFPSPRKPWTKRRDTMLYIEPWKLNHDIHTLSFD